uniref:Uncharacterized protein n=1 Tax=Arundo donax TaxID=35708 RepID=A0A0A9HU18_ARUDO
MCYTILYNFILTSYFFHFFLAQLNNIAESSSENVGCLFELICSVGRHCNCHHDSKVPRKRE